MMSHLNRKHKGIDLDHAQSVESVPVAESSSTNEEQQHEVNAEGAMVDLSPRINHQVYEDTINTLERSAALFLLSLKERYEITQTALDFAVSQVQQMVLFAVEDVKELFQTTLLPSLQAGGSQVELADIDECFQAPNPFSNLQSEHMQTKYYRENLVRVGSMRFEVLEPPRTSA